MRDSQYGKEFDLMLNKSFIWEGLRVEILYLLHYEVVFLVEDELEHVFFSLACSVVSMEGKMEDYRGFAVEGKCEFYCVWKEALFHFHIERAVVLFFNCFDLS